MGFIKYVKNTYHRNLLEKLLIETRHLIKGKILDVGSMNRRYDKLYNGQITAIDINPNPEFNVIRGDLTSLEFQSNEFDAIICIEVFEFLEPESVEKGIEEIYRVLKQGGILIFSIPFYFYDHRDNIRLTYNFIKNYFIQLNKFNFKIIKFGNKYTTLYDSIRYRLIEKRLTLLKGIDMIPIMFIYYLIIKIFSLENKKDLFYSGLFIIASKK